MQPYRHEPLTDFTVEANREAFLAALKKVESELGRDYPLVIGGERVMTEDKITSINPANKTEVVGRVAKANKELAERAMKPLMRRSALGAGQVRKRGPIFCSGRRRSCAGASHEFSAWLVKEAGKPWREADADTAEAIDFMEYYGRQMLKLKDGIPVESRPGETNRFFYIPLGVGVVISPWNFPFAIMAGTTVASLVTGNTVLLKPASATRSWRINLWKCWKKRGFRLVC
ncbi:1-pyrroline-5-carboxylate dehydrogenase 1 [[Flavobacterium] thermophilum]|nr:1-pyrroline-5-carboxylate dehydrogenase 1 [[Flavobacterium] thermophilum]